VLNERGAIVWRNVGSIETGDTVVSALFGADEAAGNGDMLSEDEAVLLGYLVAEGSLRSENAVRFTNWDDEVGGEFCRLMGDLYDAEPKKYGDGDYAVHSGDIRTDIAERYGLDYINAAGKTIPAVIRTAGSKLQRAFLSALFEGDGWIDKSTTVGLASASEQLARSS
jgi:recombination protein RecA